MRRFYLLPVVIAFAVCFPLTAGAFTLDIAGNATVLNRELGDPVPTSLKLVSTALTFNGAPEIGDSIVDWSDPAVTDYATLNGGNIVYSSSRRVTGYIYIGAGSYLEANSSSLLFYVWYFDSNFNYVGWKGCPQGTTILEPPANARYIRVDNNRTNNYVTVTCTDAVRSNLTLANLTFDGRDTVQSYPIPTDVTDTQLVVQSSAGTAVFAVPGLSSREVVIPPADPPMPTPVSIVSVETTLPVSAEIPDLDFELYQTALVVVVCVAGLAFVYMLRKKRR